MAKASAESSRLTDGPAQEPPRWTASKCQRLLRPLISNIAALRKQGDKIPARNAVVNNDGKRPTDPDTHPGKKVRVTYALRRPRGVYDALPLRPRASSRRASGVLTPVSPHALNSRVGEPQLADSLARDGSVKRTSDLGAGFGYASGYPAEFKLATLQPVMDRATFTIYKAISKALEAILKATSDQQTMAKPRSLMAMCLRKIPDYITQLEHQEKQDAEESGTKSAIQDAGPLAAVYSELETFGIGLENGWGHIQIALRAHAVKILADAFVEGLLEVDFMKALHSMCCRLDARREGAELLLKAIEQYHRIPARVDSTLKEHGPGELLNLMINEARHFRSTDLACLTKTLCNLLSQKLLPIEWLLTTTFNQVWGLAKSAALGPCAPMVPIDSDSGMNFLTTALRLLCLSPRPKPAATQRLSAAFGTVDPCHQEFIARVAMVVGTVFAIQNQDFINTTTDSASLDNAVKKSKAILQSCIAACEGSKKEEILLRRYILRLAVYFCDRFGTGCKINATLAWKEVAEHSTSDHLLEQRYSNTIAFLVKISLAVNGSFLQPASRGQFTLETFVQRVAWLNVPDCVPSLLLKDAAFLLAEKTNDRRDLAFAEHQHDEHKKFESRLAMKKSASSNSAAGPPAHYEGYGWDASVSEWIMASPEHNKQAKQAVARKGDRSRSAEETKQNNLARTLRPRASLETPQEDGAAAKASFTDEVLISSVERGIDNQLNMDDALQAQADRRARCRHARERQQRRLASLGSMGVTLERRYNMRVAMDLRRRSTMSSNTTVSDDSEDELAG